MFSQSLIYQWHWEIYQGLPMINHWFLLAMICRDLHQTFFHGILILLFWEEHFKAKVSSVGQRLQILAFFFLCKAGQGYIWIIFSQNWLKELQKMTRHGFEIFTFLFYFFERIILRLKSAQLDKWYIIYISPLYLAVQGHFCVLFNKIGENAKNAKTWF